MSGCHGKSEPTESLSYPKLATELRPFNQREPKEKRMVQLHHQNPPDKGAAAIVTSALSPIEGV